VAHYWQAQSDAARGEVNEAAWHEAIDHWAGVLASHEYWRAWGEQRAVSCGVLGDDLPLLRRWLLTRFVRTGAREQERLERVIDGVVAARQSAHSSLETGLRELQARADAARRDIYVNLSIQFAQESGAAVRLERVRVAEDVATAAVDQGLPESFEQWLRGGDWQDDAAVDAALLTAEALLDCRSSTRAGVLSCGPRMLTRLGLIDETGRWVDGSRPRRTSIAGLDGLLDRVRRDALQLRFYLDPELGPLIAMVDVGQYDRCTSAIKRRLEGGRDGRSRDLEKVLCLASHDHGEAALARGDLDLAVRCLETAYAYCLTALTDPHPFSSDVPRLCEKVCDAIGRTGSDTEVALALLERLVQAAPGACVIRVHAVHQRLLRWEGERV
jgi:hypothetical protein